MGIREERAEQERIAKQGYGMTVEYEGRVSRFSMDRATNLGPDGNPVDTDYSQLQRYVESLIQKAKNLGNDWKIPRNFDYMRARITFGPFGPVGTKDAATLKKEADAADKRHKKKQEFERKQMQEQRAAEQAAWQQWAKDNKQPVPERFR